MLGYGPTSDAAISGAGSSRAPTVLSIYSTANLISANSRVTAVARLGSATLTNLLRRNPRAFHNAQTAPLNTTPRGVKKILENPITLLTSVLRGTEKHNRGAIVVIPAVARMVLISARAVAVGFSFIANIIFSLLVQSTTSPVASLFRPFIYVFRFSATAPRARAFWRWTEILRGRSSKSVNLMGDAQAATTTLGGAANRSESLKGDVA